MSFDLNKKIAFLDGLVGGTLALTHFTKWELASYESNSMFSQKGLIGHVHAKDFSECVDRAFELVRREVGNV